jgi:hypothetical protein
MIHNGKWSGLTPNAKRLSIALHALRVIATQNNYAGTIARNTLKECSEIKAKARAHLDQLPDITED